MPALIDWGARFGLIAEAVVAVVLREGANAVTVATVAAEMGVSPNTVRRSLRGPDVFCSVALEHLCRVSRVALFHTSSDDVREHGQHVARLISQLPTTDEGRSRWIVWQRLVHALEDRRRLPGPGMSADRSGLPEPDVPVHRSVEEHEERLALLVELAARDQGVDEDLLRVLVDGIIANVVLGRLRPGDVRARFGAWLQAAGWTAGAAGAEAAALRTARPA